MSILVGIVMVNSLLLFTIGTVYIIGKLTAIGGEKIIKRIKRVK